MRANKKGVAGANGYALFYSDDTREITDAV